MAHGVIAGNGPLLLMLSRAFSIENAIAIHE
ncbi:hypothetical protein B398_07445 [Xylella fastidiosa 32]|nr:hypothetical protein B398_07445 [Xylella fastidiosa 32]